MKKYILSRLSEPSTWSGLGLLAAAFGFPAAILPVIAKVGVAVSAVIAVAVPEGK